MIGQERQSNGDLMLIDIKGNSPKATFVIPKGELEAVEAAIKAAKEHRDINPRVRAWLNKGMSQEIITHVGLSDYGSPRFKLVSKGIGEEITIYWYSGADERWLPFNKVPPITEIEHALDWIAAYGWKVLSQYDLQHIS
jgi:hypothetical protein